MPASPLPGLDACAAFAQRVVGTLWWHTRFPDRGVDAVPRLRPGNGARQAFFRPGDDAPGHDAEHPDPSITLPRRYRTKGVVLHELCHWALASHLDLPHHGRTFTRVLLDATEEFLGSERADMLEASYLTAGVRIGRVPRAGPDGILRYGWDERLHLGRGKRFVFRYEDDRGEQAQVTGVLKMRARSGHELVLDDSDGPEHLPTAWVWAVEPVAAEHL